MRMYSREKQAFIYIALQTILIIPYLPVLFQVLAGILALWYEVNILHLSLAFSLNSLCNNNINYAVIITNDFKAV